MSDEEQEGIDWDAAIQQHYDEAKCEVCGEHVVLDEDGRFFPVGAGIWAAWYHYTCDPGGAEKGKLEVK